MYLDPPYDPVSDTASFTGYNKGGFDKEEQKRLKRCCDLLDKRGVKFMLSNSATEFIKSLYGDYDVTIVKAKRIINSNVNGRGAVDEVLIRNYGKKMMQRGKVCLKSIEFSIKLNGKDNI